MPILIKQCVNARGEWTKRARVRARARWARRTAMATGTRRGDGRLLTRNRPWKRVLRAGSYHPSRPTQKRVYGPFMAQQRACDIHPHLAALASLGALRAR
jgi:uncharacterized protein VirK/YbjX